MGRNFTIYLIVISVSFLMGLLALLIGPHLFPVQRLNTYAFHQLTANPAPAEQKYDGFYRQRDDLVSHQAAPETLPLSIVEIDLNNNDVFSSTPPSASDTAVIINTLKNSGVKNIFFSTHLKWDKADDFDSILRASMDSPEPPKLAHITIPLILSRSANESPLPAYLKSSSLPLNLANGDTSQIPKVNRVVNDPVDGILFKSLLDIPQNCRFGVAQLDSETSSDQHIFLLSQWGNHLLLHSSLLNLLSLMEISLSDISIEMGESISLGANKPSIKIDEYGRTKLNIEGQAPSAIAAHRLLEKGKLKDVEKSVLITSKPSPQHTTQLIQSPYLQLLNFSTYSTTEKRASYLRLPLWLEACILINLSLFCIWLYRLNAIYLHLAFIGLISSTWLISYILFDYAEYWLPICPPLFVTLTGWLICTILKKKWRLRRRNTGISKSAKKALARFD